MSLSDDFQSAFSRRSLSALDDNRIKISESVSIDSCGTGYTTTIYDFMQRRVMTVSKYNDTCVVITPFKDVDREVLENMHLYLVNKGKKPLPLPEIEQKPGLNFGKDFGGGMK